MADVKMPDSVPCLFDKKGWAPCKKPSTNGWCSKHENLVCASCGKKATRSCDAQMGGLLCGVDICDNCGHSPEDGSHVSLEVVRAYHDRRRAEGEAAIASRNSPVQMMNDELGVSLNLTELLKGDTGAWPIVEFYYLELEHGLMAFFPATVGNTKRIVITVDKGLIVKVWETLPRRESKVGTSHGYYNKERSILYPILGHSDYDKETSRPQKVLTESEFDQMSMGGVNSFRWASGLFGGRDVSEEEFSRKVQAFTGNSLVQSKA